MTTNTRITHTATSTLHNIYNDFNVNPQTDFYFSTVGEGLLVIGIVTALWAYITLSRTRISSFSSLFSIPRCVISAILIILGSALLLIGYYFGSIESSIPLTFSNHAMSASAWEAYKTTYTEKGSSRTVDPDRNNITTSEGQSYTMLRAVWLDDKDTFDKSWKWTRENLKRPHDNLFSWKYGPLPSGNYGIQVLEGGDNTATDADSDIALSLVFAYARWQDPQYLIAAKGIIHDIWNIEVATINGTPYLTSNNNEKNSAKGTIIVNPSYFAPYSYRIFATIDPTHPWLKLVDSSYAVLDKSSQLHLDSGTSANLIPDWIQINQKTGAISAIDSTSLTTHYSFDAMRAPWRMALDYQWNNEPRAKQVLDRMTFVRDFWREKGKIFADYAHNGAAPNDYEAPAIYGGTIGYFIVSDPIDASAMYRQKLLVLFDPDNNSWRETLSYYDDNWAWFGMALYNDQLPNLAKNIPALGT